MHDDQNSGRGYDPRARVLLFDADPRVRSGFADLLSGAAVNVTATDDPVEALNEARRGSLAVAVVDLDTPGRDGGLQLLAELREGTPDTCLILLSARQSFAVAVQALRLGVTDVVTKAPENIGYLTNRVLKACSEGQPRVASRELLTDALVLVEDFLKELVEASRKAAQAEDHASGVSSLDEEQRKCVLFVVDDDASTAVGLKNALRERAGYHVVGLQTGGEALDRAGGGGFQLALVKDGLPDLPSSIVAKSLRAECEEGMVVLFSHPTPEGPGRADIIETGRTIELIPALSSGGQLIEQIDELRKALVARRRERRYLQTFRRRHQELLRRYADLRHQLVAEIGD